MISVAVSADGKTLIANFQRGRIVAYRTSDQGLIGQVGTDALRAAVPAISPDGALVATDDPLQVWQVGSETPLLTIPLGTLPVFSPDGKQVLALLPADMEVWDIASGKMVQSAGTADTAVFANGGSQIVAHTHQDKTVRFVQTGKAVPSITVPIDESAAHQLSPLGTMMVGYAPSSTQDDGATLQAYHLPDGHLLWSAQIGRKEDLMTFSPDDREVIVYSGSDYASRGDIHAIDTSTGSGIVLPGTGYHTGLTRMALGPQGNPTVMVTESGIFELNGINADTGRIAVPDSSFPLQGQGMPIASIAVSNDGRWLATGSLAHEQSAIVWDLAARKVQRILPTDLGSATVVFTPDAHDVVTGWSSIKAWSVVAGNIDWSWVPLPGAAGLANLTWLIAIAPAGDRIATNWGTGVVFGSTADSTFAAQLDTGRSYAAVAFSPDGQTLATSGPALWRVSDATRIWPAGNLTPPPSTNDNASVADNWVAFSPDGTLILVSEFVSNSDAWLSDYKSYGTTTKLYRASDGALVRDLGNSLGRRPAFSPDGAWIVTGSFVYPAGSLPPVQLAMADAYFDSVSTFAPDGTIVVGGTDGVTRLYCPQ